MLNHWEESAGPPDWFQGFERTRYQIHTDDQQMVNSGGYAVFTKEFPHGEVRLGAPCGRAKNAMYFGFLASVEQGKEILRNRLLSNEPAL